MRHHRTALRQYPLRCRHQARRQHLRRLFTPDLATTCGEVSVVDLALDDGHRHGDHHGRLPQPHGDGSQQPAVHRRPHLHQHQVPSSGSNPGEVRGCLSILNTSKSTVVVPAPLGDVTGIQPISRRNVVYVVQNGELEHLRHHHRQLQTTQVDIIGQAVDVKQVD